MFVVDSRWLFSHLDKNQRQCGPGHKLAASEILDCLSGSGDAFVWIQETG